VNRRRTPAPIRLSVLIALTVVSGVFAAASRLDDGGAEIEASLEPAATSTEVAAASSRHQGCVDIAASRPRMTPNDPDIIPGLMDRSTILLVPPPGSEHEVVARADAIVIGTVAGIEREAVEGPYSPEDGTLQPPRVLSSVNQGGNVIEHPGIGVTYYTVEIERVLMSDGRIDEGGSFELRLFGHTSELDGTGSGVMPGQSHVAVGELSRPDRGRNSEQRGLIGQRCSFDRAAIDHDWATSVCITGVCGMLDRFLEPVTAIRRLIQFRCDCPGGYADAADRRAAAARAGGESRSQELRHARSVGTDRA
jgi:hypothetical protein